MSFGCLDACFAGIPPQQNGYPLANTANARSSNSTITSSQSGNWNPQQAQMDNHGHPNGQPNGLAPALPAYSHVMRDHSLPPDFLDGSEPDDSHLRPGGGHQRAHSEYAASEYSQAPSTSSQPPSLGRAATTAGVGGLPRFMQPTRAFARKMHGLASQEVLKSLNTENSARKVIVSPEEAHLTFKPDISKPRGLGRAPSTARGAAPGMSRSKSMPMRMASTPRY